MLDRIDNMKIVYCHNYYRHRGGEDVSFESDVEMLRDEGHTVVPFTRDNKSLGSSNLQIAAQTIWNRSSYREMYQVLKTERPDVLHCNNLFPQISVSVYRAARQLGIPIVQALRNYRTFCANSFLYRDGQTCTKCLTAKAAWHGLRYRCYRGSLAATSVVVAMQLFHRCMRIQRKYVDAFVTPTAFARDTHIRGGFNPESIFVRTNFLISDLGPSQENRNTSYALFVGRLSEEKGVDTVIDAWCKQNVNLKLRIVGDGPEEAALKKQAGNDNRIEFLGALDLRSVLEQIGSARCLIMPSRWYETFGRTIAEAFSRGTPVIASRLGAMAELVQDGVNGYCFEAGNSPSLAAAVEKLVTAGREQEQRLRSAARRTYESRFSRNISYSQLLQIYDFALRQTRMSQAVGSEPVQPARSSTSAISNGK